MTKEMRIGAAARLSGLSVKAIRFYEESGFVPAPLRSESGYRRFSAQDVRRLRFIRRMRQLDVPLSEVRPLVESGLTSDCGEFASELRNAFARQREEITRRIEELEALRRDLDDLAEHVAHCECEPGQKVVDCDYCAVLGEEGGECK
jgi:DNA-binding transcriptional MerR regulator